MKRDKASHRVNKMENKSDDTIWDETNVKMLEVVFQRFVWEQYYYYTECHIKSVLQIQAIEKKYEKGVINIVRMLKNGNAACIMRCKILYFSSQFFFFPVHSIATENNSTVTRFIDSKLHCSCPFDISHLVLAQKHSSLIKIFFQLYSVNTVFIL